MRELFKEVMDAKGVELGVFRDGQAKVQRRTEEASMLAGFMGFDGDGLCDRRFSVHEY